MTADRTSNRRTKKQVEQNHHTWLQPRLAPRCEL